METLKSQNYKGYEIRRTVDGYYIFVKGDVAHSGPYCSILAAKGISRHYRGWGWDTTQ